jgi:FixJ family two-component response regulator
LSDIHHTITTHIKDHSFTPLPASQVPALSPRQRSILDGILGGQANKAMAYDLGISVKTVETHRRRLMDKFGASSLADLVRLCVLAGIGLSSALLP